MSKIDIDRFICSLMSRSSLSLFYKMEESLEDQGLEYKDGEIVDIDKAQTIKFNEPLTNAEKRYFDKILFNDVRYKPIDFDKVDIDKMVEDFKEEESKVLLPLGFSKGNIEHLSIAYKNGIEDVLKVIKEGGE